MNSTKTKPVNSGQFGPRKGTPYKKSAKKQPKKYTKVSKRDFLKILSDNHGVVTTACKETGLPPDWFSTWYKTSSLFKRRVDNIQNEVIDYVEEKLLKAIEEGNISATIFYMKCKGRERGYVEKSDREISGAIELKITKTIIKGK